MPRAFGRGRRRPSRSSIGSTWCRICAMPWSGSSSAIGGTSIPWRLQGIDPQRPRPRLRRSARRATPAGSTATTRSSGCTPNTWGWPPSRGRSRSVARPSIGISPCPSRPSGNGHGTAGSSDDAFHPIFATAMECRLSQCPTALAGAGGPGAPAVTDDGGAVRRPIAAGDRYPFKFRQVPPAPLYDANHAEGSPPPLTALRAARLFLSKAEDRRSTDQAQLTRLLRLDPVMPLTYHQVQAFCRMVRERRGHELDAWIAEVQQTGVKELRAFVKGLLKDAAAVYAGLSLVWSNGPTEGFIHRLKLLKRQAYGRAGVDFLRHRLLASSAEAAA